MASWIDVSAAAEELAAAVRERFDAHGLGLLATLRPDGSPRISGIEPMFYDRELWLGMMPDSLKVADLLRDARLALHSATVDKDVAAGDAKLTGRGVEVPDGAEKSAYLAELKLRTGFDPGVFNLFRVDVTGISLLRPVGDHLVIESWREGQPVKRVERR